MGLDIYVGRCDDLEEAGRLESEYNERSEVAWGTVKYADMTDGEKEDANAKCDAIKAELGLIDWGKFPGRENIEHDSALYPEHYFKVGYFRSSYNNAGLNSIARRMRLPSLNDIFEPGDRYEFVPEWASALSRTKDALDAWKEAAESFDVVCVQASLFNPDYGPTTAADALDVFKRVRERGSAGEFSCIDGAFYMDGLEIYAVIPGKSGFGPLHTPCAYVVHKSDLDWYIQALEIVQETINYVLAQPDSEKHYLHWSS